MREIEFRAFIKPLNKMVKVERLFLYDDIEKQSIIYKIKPYERDLKYFKDIELMQYVGLKDKNGVKIFEGDIVNICGFADKDVVEYDNYYVGYVLKSYDKNGKVIYITPLIEYSSIVAPKLEVIGNIWEHKHLLGEDETEQNIQEYYPNYRRDEDE